MSSVHPAGSTANVAHHYADGPASNERDIRISSIARRLFHSPIVRTVLAVTAVVLTGCVLLGSPLLIPVVGGASIALALYVARNIKKLVYEASLHISLARPRAAWHPIAGTNIILGRQPLKNRGEHRILQEEYGVSRVLSLLEQFEFETLGIASEAAQPEDWATLGVDQRHLEAVDFKALELETIRQAVAYLAEGEEAGETTYCHCKGGVGRSATAVACFLVEHRGMTANEAIEHVRASRPCIMLNRHQRAVIQLYEEECR